MPLYYLKQKSNIKTRTKIASKLVIKLTELLMSHLIPVVFKLTWLLKVSRESTW